MLIFLCLNMFSSCIAYWCRFSLCVAAFFFIYFSLSFLICAVSNVMCVCVCVCVWVVASPFYLSVVFLSFSPSLCKVCCIFIIVSIFLFFTHYVSFSLSLSLSLSDSQFETHTHTHTHTRTRERACVCVLNGSWLLVAFITPLILRFKSLECWTKS